MAVTAMPIAATMIRTLSKALEKYSAFVWP
jgi:hypothetical protein